MAVVQLDAGKKEYLVKKSVQITLKDALHAINRGANAASTGGVEKYELNALSVRLALVIAELNFESRINLSDALDYNESGLEKVGAVNLRNGQIFPDVKLKYDEEFNPLIKWEDSQSWEGFDSENTSLFKGDDINGIIDLYNRLKDETRNQYFGHILLLAIRGLDFGDSELVEIEPADDNEVNIIIDTLLSDVDMRLSKLNGRDVESVLESIISLGEFSLKAQLCRAMLKQNSHALLEPRIAGIMKNRQSFNVVAIDYGMGFVHPNAVIFKDQDEKLLISLEPNSDYLRPLDPEHFVLLPENLGKRFERTLEDTFSDLRKWFLREVFEKKVKTEVIDQEYIKPI